MIKQKISNSALCAHFNIACYQVEASDTTNKEEIGKFFVSTLANEFVDAPEIPLADSLEEAEALAVKYLNLAELYVSYEVSQLCNRLLDSEEHAGESAIPQVAEDAVELLLRLAGSITKPEKVKISIVRGGTTALKDIAAGNITDEVLYQFHEFKFSSQAEADAFLEGASIMMGCHEYLRPNNEVLKQIRARQSSKRALQKLAQEAFSGMHLELLDVLNGIGCPEDLLVVFNGRVSTVQEAEYRMELLTNNPTYETAIVLFLASLGEFGRMESPEDFDEFCKLHGFPYIYRLGEMSAVTQ